MYFLGWIAKFASRMRKRDVLRAGYGAMFLLLIVSAIEAYRIQRSASQQSAEVYHRYVKGEEILYRCRRALFLGGIHARDFLLNNQRDRAPVFREQLSQLQLDSRQALAELDGLPPPRPSSSELKAKTQEYWDALESILRWSDEERTRLAFDFVQREIAPRRNAAGDLVRELREASQGALRSSEQELAQGQQSATLRLVLMVSLCILSGLAVAYFSLAHSENLERETVRQYRQLEHLSSQLLAVQEDERKRIARELHDEIGQTLTALHIEASHAQSLWKSGTPGVEERLEQVRSLAAKTLQTVRDISLLLRPPLLDDLGLGEALQWHVDEFTRRTGILCDFSEDGAENPLADSSKICVYRIVQEALHNCEAHSGASRVRVSIRQSPQQLVAEIEDDGRGIAADPTATDGRSKGLGILGMRERAVMLGGTLHLHSSSGKGTRVTLSLPLSKSALSRQERISA